MGLSSSNISFLGGCGSCSYTPGRVGQLPLQRLVGAGRKPPLVFRSWQVWETGHLPGSSHAIPPDNRTVPDSSHSSGSPAGLCSSQWDLAGVGVVTASAPGFLNSFLPGHCGEKVTWLYTCLCRDCTQPNCCCDLGGKPLCWLGVPKRAGNVTDSPFQAGQAVCPPT